MDATLGTASTDSGLLEGVGLPADDIRAWHAAGSAFASTIAATPGTLDAARTAARQYVGVQQSAKSGCDHERRATTSPRRSPARRMSAAC